MCSAVSGILTRSTTSLTIMELNIMVKFHQVTQRLETEPSLVEPQPAEIKYSVVWADVSTPNAHNYADELFETRDEAIDFVLEDLGLKILEVQIINKGDPHFE